jgi:dTDP-4-amino-4,6-dideoxygalactose transaminase
MGASREEIRLRLEQENIESRPLWKPMHLQPVFKGFPFYGRGISQELFEGGLCLPSGSNLEEKDLERVVNCLQKVYRK